MNRAECPITRKPVTKNDGSAATTVAAMHPKLTASTRRPYRTPSPATILDHLPVEKRGPLVALSVEVHYVGIQT